MMNAELDWTRKLGDAVLAQQTDVMDAIQRLRLRAQDNGKLTTTPEQKVTVEQQDNRRTVVIEQASDDMVYVPAYDPGVVYGAWPYADYPPSYWDTRIIGDIRLSVPACSHVASGSVPDTHSAGGDQATGAGAAASIGAMAI